MFDERQPRRLIRIGGNKSRRGVEPPREKVKESPCPVPGSSDTSAGETRVVGAQRFAGPVSKYAANSSDMMPQEHGG